MQKEKTETIKPKPFSTKSSEEPAAYIKDRHFYRAVAYFLGLSVVIGLIGSIILAVSSDKDPPDILLAVASAALGALAGVLNNDRKR